MYRTVKQENWLQDFWTDLLLRMEIFNLTLVTIILVPEETTSISSKDDVQRTMMMDVIPFLDIPYRIC
jgi:hypothetical protein